MKRKNRMQMSKENSSETDYEEYWKERIKENYMPIMPRHQEIVRIITQTKKSGRVLDLGCGEGHILQMLPDTYEKYGSDISKTALGLVNKKSINVKSCDLNKDFPLDMEFDFIICSEVLEHLENPSNILENVKEHLTKEGLFLVTTPNVSHWRYRINRLFGKLSNYDRSHVNDWDLDSFIQLLQNYGYRIVDFYPTYFSFPHPFFSKLSLLKRVYRMFGEQFLFVCKYGAQ